MTYSGPLRMHKLDMAGAVCAQRAIQCAHCFQLLITAKRFQCSACKCTTYCSAHCQQQNWKYHQKECKTCADKQQVQVLFERVAPTINFDDFCASSNLLAIIQLPAGVMQPIKFSNLNSQHFPRFLVFCRNIQIVFDDVFDGFVYPENQQLFFTKIVKHGEQREKSPASYTLPKNLQTYKPLHYDDTLPYFAQKCENEDCKSLAFNGKCSKCGNDQIILTDAEQTISQFLQLLHFARFQLMFPQLDVTGKYIKLEFIEAIQADYQKSAHHFRDLSADNFVPTAAQLLKRNHVHHLSLGLYYINLYVLERLLKLNGTHREIDQFLGDVKLHVFCLGLYKTLKHYFSNTYTFFVVLRKIVLLTNVYTISQLEMQGPEPLQQDFNSLQDNMANQGLQFSSTEIERMQGVAKRLVGMQKVCLGFAEDLKEFADSLGDEQISLETDRLVGQVDCRVENLESWLDPEQNEERGFEEIPDMAIRGQPYTGDEKKPSEGQQAQQRVDVLE